MIVNKQHAKRSKEFWESNEGLRKALLTFIGDVANWDVANHPRWSGVVASVGFPPLLFIAAAPHSPAAREPIGNARRGPTRAELRWGRRWY